MSITVLIPYCEMGHIANLEGCLKSLRSQTRPPDAIIIIDDSADADKEKVMKVCEPYVTNFINLPFNNYVPQWGKKFNAAFPMVKTDMIMLCCSNWALGSDWLQEVESNLKLLGRKNMIAGDSARCQPMHTDQPPAAMEAWKNAPPLFEVYNYNLIDEGFLTLMWTADWIPWDDAFDQVASWHSVIEWGYRYIYAHDNHLWIRQHLTALHQHIPEDSLRENMGSNEYLKQIEVSSQHLSIKLDMMKGHAAGWIIKNMQRMTYGTAGHDVLGRFTV